jgi:eukaryotic-like serine/threonine-protein kinase
VYFGSNDTYLYSINASTGKPRWNFKTEGFVNCNPSIDENNLYFGSIDAKFYILNYKSGKEKLHIQLEELSGIWSSPLVINDIIYVFSNSTYFTMLYGIDKNSGKIKSDMEIPGRVYASPVFCDGILYFGCKDNNLYAIK